MRAVLLLDGLVVVAVVFCAFKVGVVAGIPGQHGNRYQDTQSTYFSREIILLLRSPSVDLPPPRFDSFPAEMIPDSSTNFQASAHIRRKRGQRGGLRRRLRRNITNLPLPSIVLANTRSIRPKPPNYNFDEFAANVAFMREFRDACLLCISETWFDDKISDDSVFLDGFGSRTVAEVQKCFRAIQEDHFFKKWELQEVGTTPSSASCLSVTSVVTKETLGFTLWSNLTSTG
ncbi:hypothetical protein C0Q70_10202 [Pomacea canaliculata]|uniref:Uncharacterized protein n=1 Tax=Pomacea canaliculata TaxID=400727 RepID=A0A2T7PBY3_POMCA|nr:hypothetical protein C0Q70_10202 [Pomacea canaliculata]